MARHRLLVLLDEAGWGAAHLRPLRASPRFDVVGLVMASDERRAAFRAGLFGRERGWRPTRPPRPVTLPAEIPVHRVDDAGAPDVLEWCQQRRPDALLCAAFPQIFDARFLDVFGDRLYNSHPAALPALRGASPVFWAVATGATESGATIHRLVREVDAGPIVAQRTVPVLPSDTAAALGARIVAALPAVLDGFADALDRGDVGVPQDAAAATWFRVRTPLDDCVAWDTMDATAVDRRVRAADGRTYTWAGPVKVWIRRATPVTGRTVLGDGRRVPPGTVVQAGPDGATVATAAGLVRIDARAPLGVRFPLRLGQRLG